MVPNIGVRKTMNIKKRLEELQIKIKAMQADPLLKDLTGPLLGEYKKMILELSRLRRQQTRMGKKKWTDIQY